MVATTLFSAPSLTSGITRSYSTRPTTLFSVVTGPYWIPTDDEAPSVSNVSPTSGAVIARNGHIYFDLADTESGLVTDTIQVSVDVGSGYADVTYYDSGFLLFESGWYGIIAEITDGYSFDIYPSTLYVSNQTIRVRVEATDLAGNTLDTSWSYLVSGAEEVPHILVQTPFTSSKWNTDSGLLSESDRSETNFSSSRLSDSYTHLVTKPTSAITSESECYVTIQVPIEWDTWAILNHNLHKCATGGVTITLEASSSSNYSPSSESYPTISVTTRNRIVKHYGAVYDYQYLRFWIRAASGNFTTRPYIGELIVGETYKLRAQFELGRDHKALEGKWDDVRTADGSVFRTHRWAGAADTPLSLTFQTDTQAQVLRDAYAEMDYGVKPCLIIPHPLTAPNDAVYGMLPDRLTIPYTGPSVCRVDTEFTEVRPFLSEE